MIKSSLVLLQIILATNVVFSANINAVKEGFLYLGPFRSAGKIQGRAAAVFDENDYYVSVNSNTANWATAEATCKNIFGTNSSTVAIETAEEWDFLKIMLESYGFGSTYWTNGMYDSSARVWRWASSGQPIMASPPWDAGNPIASPTSIHRIVISHSNRYSASWRSVQNTQQHRFICQVPRATPIPSPCTNDVVIVLDSSASVGSHYFREAKSFAAKLASELILHVGNRIAFLIYSDTVNPIINISNSLSPQEMNDAILNAPYLRGGTETHIGVNEAIAQFNSCPRGVPLNIVVITEGESNNPFLLAASISSANAMGIRVMAVGITPSAVQNELLLIANGQTELVFSTNACDQLLLLSDALALKFCPK